MRILIASCTVDYAGKLTSHLPLAPRLILVKADGSVSVHADDGAYKPLNWMSAPCTATIVTAGPGDSFDEIWEIRNKAGDTLRLTIGAILSDQTYTLGRDPGLAKDGVEKHLQVLLAENPHTIRPGLVLVRREHPTPIGPVDLLLRGAHGYVAVEVKRRGEIDGVEQLTRYLELMRRDPLLGDVEGVLVAQLIKPQARVLANDRGITCVTVDYDELRGIDHSEDRLF